MKRIVLTLAVLAIAALITGGCARKHIESAPATQRPVVKAEPKPEPGIIEETYVVGGPEKPMGEPLDAPIEEVYEVDAAKEAGTSRAAVGETELAEEPLPDADQLRREADAAAGVHPPETGVRAEEAASPSLSPEDEQVMSRPIEGTEVAPVSGGYYVQVGAFSDLENANRALARLLADGYKGSVMIRTDEGLFRVQAGAFPDEISAGVALDKLRTDYPKGFVLKKP
ncbi:MAG: SPOR domain-containing protein [Pseudodesulfovibrio sp.]|jgi:cell division septation protein DedD|uniref:SPOR domain-containing protein n=1 Tax=Pseudodesulfovibrio sp. TaxID=2035812 RepID=UPI003D14809A